MRHRSCCCSSVITDGGAQLYDGDVQTTRRTRQAAAYEKAQGIVVLAIGAGEGVNAVELAAMASEPKARRWTTLGSFHSLRRLSEELAGSCVPEIQDGADRVWGCPLPHSPPPAPPPPTRSLIAHPSAGDRCLPGA